MPYCLVEGIVNKQHKLTYFSWHAVVLFLSLLFSDRMSDHLKADCWRRRSQLISILPVCYLHYVEVIWVYLIKFSNSLKTFWSLHSGLFVVQVVLVLCEAALHQKSWNSMLMDLCTWSKISIKDNSMNM